MMPLVVLVLEFLKTPMPKWAFLLVSLLLGWLCYLHPILVGK